MDFNSQVRITGISTLNFIFNKILIKLNYYNITYKQVIPLKPLNDQNIIVYIFSSKQLYSKF